MHSIHGVNRLLLQKVFLLIVLFLSGCSTIADLVSGLTGKYIANDTDHTFTISYDGLYYTDTQNHKLKKSSSNNTDCIIFTSFEVGDTDVTVILSDITGYNGVRTLYYDNIVERKSGFAWDVNASN